MPYIDQQYRSGLAPFIEELVDEMAGEFATPGMLNYVITKIIDEWLGERTDYEKINSAIGVLECAKLELYRRVAARYEDIKAEANGDVYQDRPQLQQEG
jgi:hypothetical protein